MREKNKLHDFINYVNNNYPKDLTVLEIGAGYNSTSLFYKNFKKIYSIENNKKFINLYHNNYIHIELDKDTGWYDADDFREKIPNDYDIIVLDGPLGGHSKPLDSPKPFRLGFCEISWDAIRKDVPIIVDDIDRDWREKKIVEFLESDGYNCECRKQFAICNK